MCLPVIDDLQLDQARIEHLHQVLVFQCIGNENELDLRLTIVLEAFVELLQAFEIARGLAHVHLLARKVIERLELWRLRTGHHHLADRPATLVARHKVDLLQAFVGDREVADADVSQALTDIRKQFVPRCG